MFNEMYKKRNEDYLCLIQELKNNMKENISFDSLNNNAFLTGIVLNGNKEVKFQISFCKNDFLRIQIPHKQNKYVKTINAMETLITTLSKIYIDDSSIGFPLAIYETDEYLTCEYAFQNIAETIESLKNNTIKIKNLRFLGNCVHCAHGSFGYNCNTGEEKLYCTKYYPEYETNRDEICEDHEYDDGDIPNIKVLYKAFNKK